MPQKREDGMTLYTLTEGGSGSGIGYWRKWAHCARKAWLSEQQAEFEATEEDKLAKLPNEKGLQGTLVHAYLELWREGAIDSVDEVEFEAPFEILPNPASEGKRIAKWYLENCTRDGLGKVLHTELRFENPESVRVNPFTGLIDLVTEVSDIVEFNKVNETNLTRPGNYIVDYKTTGAFRDSDTLKWEMDPQPISYFMAAKDLGFDPQGVLIEQIGTTKTPKRRVLQLAAPTEAEQEGLNKFLESCKNAKILAYDHDYKPCNWNHCLDYARVCYYKGRGCDRI